jgi:hypothetical protein
MLPNMNTNLSCLYHHRAASAQSDRRANPKIIIPSSAASAGKQMNPRKILNVTEHKYEVIIPSPSAQAERRTPRTGTSAEPCSILYVRPHIKSYNHVRPPHKTFPRNISSSLNVQLRIIFSQTGSKGRCRYEMVLIYQPPNVHARILLRNAMAAVKKINRNL